MLIFNERYNVLVDKYILPIVPYNISYTKLRQTALQELLLKKAKNVVVNSSENVTFFFDKDDLLKALLNDINLFLIRVLLQQSAASKQHNNSADPSSNWNFVTDYYYSFFLAGLLLRLCHRGTFYFDDGIKRKINEFITRFTGKVSAIGSNCYFRIDINEPDSEYSLTLISDGHKTHELVWVQIASLLSDIKPLASTKSDEYTVLCKLIDITQKQGSTFPSQLRNTLNYRPHYGLKEVERAYFVPNTTLLENRWLEPIYTFTGKVDDDQQRINLFSSYVRYLQVLSFNLIDAYFDRRGRGNGILSSINKDRTSKIVLPSACYTY